MTATAGADAATLGRKAHRTLEPLHAIAYFAPEPAEQYRERGIADGMRGYFASRSAVLGRVPAEVVVATFFNFAPDLVATAIPSVWDVTTPAAVLEAKLTGVDAAYRRVLGDAAVESAEMAEAAALAREATTVLSAPGRPLYAAYAAQPWPQPAHLQLFHAQTLLRESRGDAHVAALVLAGLGPVEALVTHVAQGDGLPESILRATRGWTDDQWTAGLARTRERGLIDEAGGLTDAGRSLRDAVEVQTDAAAAAPYLRLGPERTDRLRRLARPWARALSDDMFGGSR